MTQQLPFVPSPRNRPSPYLESAYKAGMSGVTVYNHMVMPGVYDGMLEEYRALVEDVTLWDVAVQRQVEMRGSDAFALTQYLCTRDISRVAVGQCRYTFLCNYEGGILNDPVLLRPDPDRYWLSLADRDILIWVQAIAAERGLDVAVGEPDVSPLQVQGPKSKPLIAGLFGDDIAGLPFYRCAWAALDGLEMLVSRTGWSGEFGYEVFPTDSTRASWLWERLMEAGRPYNIKPAAPNQIRRIEGGILSYGTDMDDSVNPYELGFGWVVNLKAEGDFVGRAALSRLAERGPERLMTGARIGGPPLLGNPTHYPVFSGDAQVGVLTSVAYSPRFGANLGFVLVEAGHARPGTELETLIEGERFPAVTEPIPFVERATQPNG